MGIETHVLAPTTRAGSTATTVSACPRRRGFTGRGTSACPAASRRRCSRGRRGSSAQSPREAQLRRLVVPDENATWAVTAIPAGIRLVREHGIDVVVSTSPPPSTHLIAAAIARATGVRWVADLRDSLVFHAHRRADTTATKAKAALHERVARLVASRADAITCVSEAISEETRSLEPRGPVVTIPNGADFDDVVGSSGSRRSGSASRTPGASSDGATPARSSRRSRIRPRRRCPLSRGLSRRRQGVGGGLGLGHRLELLPYATRAESLALQRDSEALLLLIPDAGGRGKGVLSGKVFEYVAVGRPILASVPLDGAAAELIRDTGAGLVAPPDDPGAIREALEELHSRWRDGRLPDVDLGAEWRDRLSAGRVSRRWPPCCALPSTDRRRARTLLRLTRRARATRRSLLRRRHGGRAGMALPTRVQRRQPRRTANARLDNIDRALGGGNSVLPAQAIAIEARGRIPAHGTFVVAVGPRQPGWSVLADLPRSRTTCGTSSCPARPILTRPGSSASPATGAHTRTRSRSGRTPSKGSRS